jgi:hypothetical protein
MEKAAAEFGVSVKRLARLDQPISSAAMIVRTV